MALNEETLKLIKQYTKEKPNCKITIGISENGNQKYYTHTQSGEISPLTNTLYEIGSITKVFTTSLLCKNLAAGIISLNDTIDKYIPALPSVLYYPTVQQLATHTAGYGVPEEDLAFADDDRKKNPFLLCDYEYMMEKIIEFAKKPITSEWEYSNFGFSVLGHILGIVNGGTYYEVMKNFIERDLNITGMQYGLDFSDSIHGFDGKEDCGNWRWAESCPYASAGFLSASVVDLLNFMDIHLYNRIPYLAAGHQVQVKIDEQNCEGLGWSLDMDDNIIWHNGGTGRFNSFGGFHVKSQTAVVVLMNDYVDLSNSTFLANTIFENYL